MCLMPEKENRESILTTFKLSMGSAYETENNQSELVIGDPTFNIKVNTELSRINGKMADFIQSYSSSFVIIVQDKMI